MIKDKIINEIIKYLPLTLNIYLDLTFTLLGQESEYFEGGDMREGNPIAYIILNIPNLNGTIVWQYFAVSIYFAILVVIINYLKKWDRIARLTYFLFWIGHLAGLTGWWFVIVGRKLLGDLAENRTIWFIASISLVSVLAIVLFVCYEKLRPKEVSMKN